MTFVLARIVFGFCVRLLLFSDLLLHTQMDGLFFYLCVLHIYLCGLHIYLIYCREVAILMNFVDDNVLVVHDILYNLKHASQPWFELSKMNCSTLHRFFIVLILVYAPIINDICPSFVGERRMDKKRTTKKCRISIEFVPLLLCNFCSNKIWKCGNHKKPLKHYSDYRAASDASF